MKIHGNGLKILLPLLSTLLFLSICIAGGTEDGFSLLTTACANGDLVEVKKLLKNGINPVGAGKQVNEPIYWAITNNYPEIVALLLDAGVDPNFDWGDGGGSLLTNAAQFGNLEVVNILVSKGADVNYRSGTSHSPLYRSIVYTRKKVALYLVNNGARLNSKDVIALKKMRWFEKKENKDFLNELSLTIEHKDN